MNRPLIEYRCDVRNSAVVKACSDADALAQLQSLYSGIRYDVMEMRVDGVWRRLDRLDARPDRFACHQNALPLFGGSQTRVFRKMGFGAYVENGIARRFTP